MKLREIAELVGGELIGDGDVEITSVADISTAHHGQLAFFEKDADLPQTNASCVMVHKPAREQGRYQDSARQAETRAVASVPLIITNNPKLAFAKAAARLHPAKHRFPEIHESAVIADVVDLGD